MVEWHPCLCRDEGKGCRCPNFPAAAQSPALPHVWWGRYWGPCCHHACALPTGLVRQLPRVLGAAGAQLCQKPPEAEQHHQQLQRQPDLDTAGLGPASRWDWGIAWVLPPPPQNQPLVGKTLHNFSSPCPRKGLALGGQRPSTGAGEGRGTYSSLNVSRLTHQSLPPPTSATLAFKSRGPHEPALCQSGPSTNRLAVTREREPGPLDAMGRAVFFWQSYNPTLKGDPLAHGCS